MYSTALPSKEGLELPASMDGLVLVNKPASNVVSCRFGVALVLKEKRDARIAALEHAVAQWPPHPTQYRAEQQESPSTSPSRESD